MRAHTITTITTARSRRSARHRALVLGLAVCSLAVPATASAFYGDSPAHPSDSPEYLNAIKDAPGSTPATVADSGSGYSSVTAISGDSSQPTAGSDYSSVNATAPPASEPGSSGSQGVDSGYTSVNAISGSPASAPTLASGSPGSGEGFDWPSALVGAGAALALAALGTALLLTVRRRTTISPSAATS
jgi:hypothetical protein